MNAFAELAQLFDPARPCFTVETAKNLLSLHSEAAKVERIEELAAKANEAALSTAEHEEYLGYIYAGKMMSMLKLQARLFLQQAAA